MIASYYVPHPLLEPGENTACLQGAHSLVGQAVEDRQTDSYNTEW